MVIIFRILAFRQNCTKFEIMSFCLKGNFRRVFRNHFLIQGSSMFKTACYAVLVSFLLTFSMSASAADVKKGKRVFNKCKACHSLKVGKNKLGPSLAKLMGRKAGTVKKFRYSKAMKKSSIIWNEKTLDQFMVKPKKFICTFINSNHAFI